MIEAIEVVTTTDREENAAAIAKMLVEAKLAACVQVFGPVRSTYRWQGKIETAQEWQCRAKSRRGLYDEIERAIRSIHPYEEPEILALPIVAGSQTYLAWLDEQVKSL